MERRAASTIYRDAQLVAYSLSGVRQKELELNTLSGSTLALMRRRRSYQQNRITNGETAHTHDMRSIPDSATSKSCGWSAHGSGSHRPSNSASERPSGRRACLPKIGKTPNKPEKPPVILCMRSV